MSLAISTSWKSFLYHNGQDLVKELQGLGFRSLELGFNLTQEMVEAIALLQKKGQIEIVSVHNYCPIPPGLERQVALPDCFSMTSLDEEERKRAVFFTQRTIDTAASLQAQAVVLHTGRVEIPDKTRDLIGLFNEGKSNTDEYTALQELMNTQRQERVAAHLDRLFNSLEELTKYARNKGVKLGVENRYYFREIPSLDELELLFKHFTNQDLFYWHDVGHAQLYENLGLLRHADYLQRFSEKMIGIHLHDIKGADDHLPPLKGEFDFTSLLSFLKADTIKVLEAHYPATAKEVVEAARYLVGLFEKGK